MSKLNEKTIAAYEGKGFNRWTKGDMDRLYINARDFGCRFNYYNSGNVRDCFFTTSDGEEVRVSNAEGRRFKATKAYIDIETGGLHIQTATDFEDEIRENIEAIMAEVKAETEPETETIEVAEEEQTETTETEEVTETAETADKTADQEVRRQAEQEEGVRAMCALMTGQVYGRRAEAFCRESGVDYPGIWDSPKFATIDGIISYVNATYDFATHLEETGTRYEDYDLKGIAREITECNGGVYTLKDGEPTWDTIQRFYVPRDEDEEGTVTFADMDDAINYVETMLGTYCGHFDAEGIAREITDWRDGKLTMVVDSIGDELLEKYDRDLKNE
jgi:hypothetical protein